MFYGCTSLTTVPKLYKGSFTVPSICEMRGFFYNSGVTTINLVGNESGLYFLSYAPVTTINLWATTPPAIYIYASGGALHVPVGTLSAYQTDSIWGSGTYSPIIDDL